MVKQFLLNADGTVPAATDAAVLLATGVTLVMPTAPPPCTAGYVAQDTDPELVDGVWYQRWEIIPHPDADRVVDNTSTNIAELFASLTPEQIAALSTVIQSLGNNNGN